MKEESFEDLFPSLKGKEIFTERSQKADDDKRYHAVYYESDICDCCLDRERVRKVIIKAFEKYRLPDKPLVINNVNIVPIINHPISAMFQEVLEDLGLEEK